MKSNINDNLKANSDASDFSEYVAHLQIHMALHARNLVPSIKSATDSREQLLQESQANFEKAISRQIDQFKS